MNRSDLTRRGPKRRHEIDPTRLTNTTCRLPVALISQIDAEAERVARENGGLLVNRSDVMRVLLQEALAARASQQK
jgi:hypothetical protein